MSFYSSSPFFSGMLSPISPFEFTVTLHEAKPPKFISSNFGPALLFLPDRVTTSFE